MVSREYTISKRFCNQFEEQGAPSSALGSEDWKHFWVREGEEKYFDFGREGDCSFETPSQNPIEDGKHFFWVREGEEEYFAFGREGNCSLETPSQDSAAETPPPSAPSEGKVFWVSQL